MNEATHKANYFSKVDLWPMSGRSTAKAFLPCAVFFAKLPRHWINICGRAIDFLLYLAKMWPFHPFPNRAVKLQALVH